MNKGKVMNNKIRLPIVRVLKSSLSLSLSLPSLLVLFTGPLE